MQHRQKQCPAPCPKGCWDLGMGLGTQAKELMGLLEAHTVVLAKAKLAGSTPTLREVEANLRRREAGGRQLSSTTQETQDPHFSPLRNLGLSHPLWDTGCGAQWLQQKKSTKAGPTPLCLWSYMTRIQGYRGRHVRAGIQQWQSVHTEGADLRDTSPGLRIQGQNHETPLLSLKGHLWCLFIVA